MSTEESKIRLHKVTIESYYTTFEFKMANYGKGDVPATQSKPAENGENAQSLDKKFCADLTCQMPDIQVNNPAMVIKQLFAIPEHFKDKATVAKILLMVMMAQIANCTEEDGTQIIKMPILYLKYNKTLSSDSICEIVEKLLRIMQGPSIWKHKGNSFEYEYRWKLNRLWYIQSQMKKGVPKEDINDYLGGRIYPGGFLPRFKNEIRLDKKVKFWIPYIDDAMLLDNGLPDSVFKEIIKESSQAMPIIMKNPAWKFEREIIPLDGEAFLRYREGTPEWLESLAQNEEIFWVITDFLKWFYKKKKRYNKWKDDIDVFKQERRNEDGYVVDQEDLATKICRQGLSLIKQMLKYSVKHYELKEDESDRILERYKELVLPKQDKKENLTKTAETEVENQPVQVEKKFSDKECFEEFLLHFVEQNISQIKKQEKGGKNIVGIVHYIDQELEQSLIVPREDLINDYKKWLKENGLKVPEEGDSKVQKALQEGKVSLRHEKGDSNNWRFTFYPKNDTPEDRKPKLPCIAIHLSDLPEAVRGRLEALPDGSE